MRTIEGTIGGMWGVVYRAADQFDELTVTDGALELHTSHFWFYQNEKVGWKDMDIGPLTTKKHNTIYLVEEALAGYEGPATLTIALMALPGSMTPPCEEKFYRGTFSNMKFISDCGYEFELATDDRGMLRPKETKDL